jgi:hypothetical protein
MAVRVTKGERIEIGFDMARCIHARNCFLKLPEVFDPSRRAWIDPEGRAPGGDRGDGADLPVWSPDLSARGRRP